MLSKSQPVFHLEMLLFILSLLLCKFSAVSQENPSRRDKKLSSYEYTAPLVHDYSASFRISQFGSTRVVDVSQHRFRELYPAHSGTWRPLSVFQEHKGGAESWSQCQLSLSLSLYGKATVCLCTSFDLAPATASQLFDLSYFTVHPTIRVPKGRSVFFFCPNDAR